MGGSYIQWQAKKEPAGTLTNGHPRNSVFQLRKCHLLELGLYWYRWEESNSAFSPVVKGDIVLSMDIQYYHKLFRSTLEYNFCDIFFIAILKNHHVTLASVQQK